MSRGDDPTVTKERYEGDTQERSWDANVKRTYDSYQQASLESIKNFQAYIQKIITDAESDTEVKRNIANQALQNAVETANMVSKQAVRHGDFAVDQQWNLEPHEAAAEAEVLPKFYLDAIKAIVVGALAEAEAAKAKKA